MKTVSLLFLSPSLLLLSGCGKPPAQGGKPGGGEMKALAIVAPVRVEPLSEKLRLVGSLEAVEQVRISAETEARVVAVLFQDGQPVAKGDTLFRLDDLRARAGVAEAAARLALARTDYDRADDLFRKETVAREMLDRAAAGLETAKAAHEIALRHLEDTVLKAPFAGRLTERRVSPGQWITRGEPLCSLVQMSPIRAVFQVPERFIGQLSTNLVVELSSAAWPDRTFAGRVDYIAPVVDTGSRTVRVHARVDNEDAALKPGMFTGLDLVFKTRDHALLVPESAVFYRGDQAMVVVRDPDGRAKYQPVAAGVRSGGNVEITAGLKAGEQVIAEGHQKVGPGMGILIAPESARYGIEAPPPDAGKGVPPAAAPAETAPGQEAAPAP